LLLNAPIAVPNLENLLYEKKNGVAYVTIKHLKVLTALNRKTLAELTAVFEDVREDCAVLGVILAGWPHENFITWADLSCAGIRDLASVTPVETEELTRDAERVFNLIDHSRKPVIAAVNGFALADGCEAAMACSIRLATEGAKFGLPEVKLGVLAGLEETQQLLLSCEVITAEDAYCIGLVHEVVPAEDLLPRAEAILKQMHAPHTIPSQTEPLACGDSFSAICATSEDNEQDAALYLEKRLDIPSPLTRMG
jgi:enoyl-CoA hydratase/carnithine racemase